MANLISEVNAAVKWHLPVAFTIAWFEQIAVIMLLALLSLGIMSHAARIPLAECGQGARGKLWHLRHRHSGRRHRAIFAGSLTQTFKGPLIRRKSRWFESGLPAVLLLGSENLKIKNNGIEKSEKFDV